MTDSHYPSPPPASAPKLTFDMAISRLEELDRRPIFGSGGEVRFRCPVHDDHKPSASVRETDDGTVVANCKTCDLPQAEWFAEFLHVLFDDVEVGNYEPNQALLATAKAREAQFVPSGIEYVY